MPAGTDVWGHGARGRQAALGRPRGFAPLHALCALAWGALGGLTPLVEVTPLPVCRPREEVARRRAVALPLLRHAPPWHVLEPREQLTTARRRRLLVAATRPQAGADGVGLGDRAPEGMTL